MKIDLNGKLALVTGSTGDLGRTMIRTLIECGADVVIHYRENIDYANRLLEEDIATGKRAITVQADITNYESVIKMRDYVISNTIYNYRKGMKI